MEGWDDSIGSSDSGGYSGDPFGPPNPRIISPETTNDILAEISHSLTRIADKYAPKPTTEEILNRTDPYHDEGNATNHRISQCGSSCKE